MVRRSLENIFGEACIPPLSDNDLTASFKALDWGDIKANWDISMFCTTPGSEMAVELPSVTLDKTVGAAD
jgi:hypothetical protein